MRKNLKPEILRLKEEGLSPAEIARELKCSASSVSYNLLPNSKEKSRARSKKHIKNKRARVKEALGSSCKRCGYNTCKRSLHFHHIDPTTKSINLADVNLYKESILIEELKKCVLICANCHGELHDKIWDINEITN